LLVGGYSLSRHLPAGGVFPRKRENWHVCFS
jgi:hypothetical protein